MRIRFLILLLFLSQLASAERILKDREADQFFPGASLIRIKSNNEMPNYIEFRKDALPNQSQFFDRLSLQAGWSSEYGWKLLNESKDALGYSHSRYMQTYQSLPVQGTQLIVHSKQGMVYSFGGVYFKQIVLPKTIVQLTKSDALQRAYQKVNAKVYVQTNSETGSTPLDFHCILKSGNSFHECWAFNIYAQEPLSRTMEYVDLRSGQILLSKNLIEHVNVNGTAVTKFSGTQTFQTDSTAANNFRLRDASRGMGVQTYNMQNGTNYTNSVDFTDADNYWNNVNAAQDEAATDAHWGAQKTYDYFFNRHGRNSIDNAGFLLKSYVHYSNNYVNAFWDGSRMTYGDGSVSQGFFVMTALDVCGHEIAHGLTNFTADLSAVSSGSDECDALNEGYSDIFGTAVERHARPTQWDWVIGGDLTCSSAGVPDGLGIRNMQNPSIHNQPSCYLGTNWDLGGECHNNDGPLNYWFYLLSTGNTANSITAVGNDTAENIAFRTLTVHLFPSADYSDARFYSIVASTELYGGCSIPTISTTNAWHAACVGNAYVAGPALAAFTADFQQTCDTSLTVQFTNTSTNGNSFMWDFGDGTTSTVYNPQHTFSSGVYQISLFVQGGTCGNDTLIQSNFIQVGPPAGPVALGTTLCSPSSVVLTATPTVATDTIRWYDAPTAGNLLATGNSFTTPVLASNTTYYAEEQHVSATFHIGPLNNSIGNGGNYTNTTRFMVFDCSQACILQSVWVFAQGAGNRTIILKNASGTILQSVTVNIPNGGSVVPLNMPIPVGTGLQLGLGTGSTVNLYRNSTGASYPYSNGPITITGNTAANSATYYYFFYDWVVKGDDCYSQRTAVPVTFTSSGNIPATISSASGSYTACTPNTITLNANTGQGFTYQWFLNSNPISGATNSSYTTTISGNYSVQISSTTPCLLPGTSPAVNVSFNVTPIVSVNPSGAVAICSGDSVTLTASGANSYTWNNGQSGSSITVGQSGSYIATGTTNGCTGASNAVLVTATPQPIVNITPSGNTTLCSGSSITVSASGASSYQWSNGLQGNSINISQAGTYNVIGISNGCADTSGNLVITVNPSPVVSISASGPVWFCPGNSVTLTATGASSYSWNNGPVTSSQVVSQSGTYYAIGSSNGCSDTSNILSTVVYPAPSASFTFTQSGNGLVNFTNTSTGANSYSWNFGDGSTISTTTSPSHQYTGSGTFVVTLIVTNSDGCRDTVIQNINVEPTGIHHIDNDLGIQLFPNPAQDEIHIKWTSEPFTGELIVFNSIGQSVFAKTCLQTNEFLIPCGSWSRGTYSLLLVSEKGNRSIQRILLK